MKKRSSKLEALNIQTPRMYFITRVMYKNVNELTDAINSNMMKLFIIETFIV